MITIDRSITWALATGVALIIGGSYLLDGPNEEQVERATAVDLEDAKLAAQRFERDLRACKKTLGPSADLVQIERTGDYVCREMPIEPTPAEVLHHYYDLGKKL